MRRRVRAAQLRISSSAAELRKLTTTASELRRCRRGRCAAAAPRVGGRPRGGLVPARVDGAAHRGRGRADAALADQLGGCVARRRRRPAARVGEAGAAAERAPPLASATTKYRVHPPARPSTRAEALRLSAVADELLEAAGDDLHAQMRAIEDVLQELVRQVYVHCSERGSLLERVRVTHHGWFVKLLLALDETRAERDAAEEAAAEEAADQEERLRELLEQNARMRHDLAETGKELAWVRRASRAASDTAEAQRARAEWRRVKNTAAFVRAARAGAGARARGSARIEELEIALEAARPELTAEGLAAVLQRLIDSLPPDEQLQLVAVMIDGLPPSIQLTMAGDVLATFTAEQLRELIDGLGHDNEGVEALSHVRAHLLDNELGLSDLVVHALPKMGPAERLRTLELLAPTLTAHELATSPAAAAAHRRAAAGAGAVTPPRPSPRSGARGRRSGEARRCAAAASRARRRRPTRRPPRSKRRPPPRRRRPAVAVGRRHRPPPPPVAPRAVAVGGAGEGGDDRIKIPNAIANSRPESPDQGQGRPCVAPLGSPAAMVHHAEPSAECRKRRSAASPSAAGSARRRHLPSQPPRLPRPRRRGHRGAAPRRGARRRACARRGRLPPRERVARAAAAALQVSGASHLV